MNAWSQTDVNSELERVSYEFLKLEGKMVILGLSILEAKGFSHFTFPAGRCSRDPPTWIFTLPN